MRDVVYAFVGIFVFAIAGVALAGGPANLGWYFQNATSSINPPNFKISIMGVVNKDGGISHYLDISSHDEREIKINKITVNKRCVLPTSGIWYDYSKPLKLGDSITIFIATIDCGEIVDVSFETNLGNPSYEIHMYGE